MIPKIVHYCWFGKGEKSDIIKKCMETWKRNCPGYEFMEWNETNFDVNMCEFTRGAYENKKWAFVSDVARLVALKKYGGFYIDTDVEILTEGALDKYLDYKRVLAFETERRIATGLFFGCMSDDELLDKAPVVDQQRVREFTAALETAYAVFFAHKADQREAQYKYDQGCQQYAQGSQQE